MMPEKTTVTPSPRLAAHIEHKQRQRAETMAMLANTPAGRQMNPRQADILSKAIRQAGRMFTVKEVMHDYRVSINTAKTDLRGLAACNALAETKRGRETLFIALPDIPKRLKAA